MKTNSSSVLVLAAALSLSALVTSSAASNREYPAAFPVKVLTLTKEGGEQIERGMSRDDVAWAMRNRVHQKLSPDVWVFSGYCADLDLANQLGCSTLIITFAHDKVATMQLVNQPAAGIIASNLKTGSTTRMVARNK